MDEQLIGMGMTFALAALVRVLFRGILFTVLGEALGIPSV